jgi:hypothetical protein
MQTHVLDRVLQASKWPVAVGAVFVLPGALSAVWALRVSIASHVDQALPVVVGAAAYLVAYWLVLRRRFMPSFFPVLEHELTHVLFALLTFHRVKGISVGWRGGGVTRIVGGANWLILIAPYFFPTLSVAAAGLCALAPSNLRVPASGIFGATLGYHAISTWRETHREQTDLKVCGFAFAAMILPAANLVALGSVIALVLDGGNGWLTFVRLAASESATFWRAACAALK